MNKEAKKRSNLGGDRPKLESPPRKKGRIEVGVEKLQRASMQTEGRMAEESGPKREEAPASDSSCLKVLTYNVWFNEQAAVRDRMKAIGEVIQSHGYPHFICFQEATHLIVELFKDSDWWDRYSASEVPAAVRYFTMVLVRKDIPITNRMELPFENSVMARGLLAARVTVGGSRFMVVTTHLESPNQGMMYSRVRIEQCRQSIELLNEFKGPVIFTGDMNWQSKDGLMPLLDGWSDVWKSLYPEEDGFTFDPKTNTMLSDKKHDGRRLDRVLAKLEEGWSPLKAEIVGNRPIEGVKVPIWSHGKTSLQQAFPSDHFGVLVTFGKSEEEDGGVSSKSSKEKK
ncbi:hypothetical protein BSKO_00458 [Bryopsis sp. KO-2023]|nr:hypothetical protein BSKO_00458 [Bryopsis sp. KO-2023]